MWQGLMAALILATHPRLIIEVRLPAEPREERSR